jgi:hypothetical protein
VRSARSRFQTVERAIVAAIRAHHKARDALDAPGPRKKAVVKDPRTRVRGPRTPLPLRQCSSNRGCRFHPLKPRRRPPSCSKSGRSRSALAVRGRDLRRQRTGLLAHPLALVGCERVEGEELLGSCAPSHDAKPVEREGRPNHELTRLRRSRSNVRTSGGCCGLS